MEQFKEQLIRILQEEKLKSLPSANRRLQALPLFHVFQNRTFSSIKTPYNKNKSLKPHG